jgi:large subunit ribosomal protein L13
VSTAAPRQRKTVSAKGSDPHSWYIADVQGKTLGRAAARIASVLRGKTKPTFTPHADAGDFVVVINAEKIKVSGRKLDQKTYFSHSQYPGGLKEEKLKDLLERKPEDVIKKAVWGMIPKTKLGRSVYKKLKVYRGPSHPHEAQNPREYQF